MSRLAELAVEVPNLRSARVACVGDIMLDQFIYGKVERISPEAPIPVLRVTHECEMLGGVGNVAANLVALGATVQVCSAVGADEAGRRIEALLGNLAGCRRKIATDLRRPTTLKTRCIAASQQMLRIDRETVAGIDQMTAARLRDAVSSALTECSVLVLSDYGKGVLDASLAQELIDLARQLGRTVIVDPKGRDYSRYAGATIVTPNRRELAEATGLRAAGDDTIVAAARALIHAHGFQSVLATRSEEGMSLVTAGGEVHHVPAAAREVYDVSGAGDTVVATLAAALSADLPIHDAALLANAAAGIAVGKVGTAVITADELLGALRQQDLMAVEVKLASPEQALRVIAGWRGRGLRIGFTNGCFDLLHPGHVTLLSRARSACDRLVVGLNSDASVTRLKGPTRPVQSEAARATVLASLASVDLLVIFNEDTPINLIQSLRPDLLFKGADYTVATVVGAEFVQSYGGRVELIDIVPGQSTTKLVQKIGGV